jgi:hypothetical protein
MGIYIRAYGADGIQPTMARLIVLDLEHNDIENYAQWTNGQAHQAFMCSSSRQPIITDVIYPSNGSFVEDA